MAGSKVPRHSDLVTAPQQSDLRPYLAPATHPTMLTMQRSTEAAAEIRAPLEGARAVLVEDPGTVLAAACSPERRRVTSTRPARTVHGEEVPPCPSTAPNRQAEAVAPAVLCDGTTRRAAADGTLGWAPPCAVPSHAFRRHHVPEVLLVPSELSPDEVHRFTHVDHRDREAIVAVVGGEIVAVARFDRLGSGRSAEVAFVVSDAWQGRGLGSLMLSHLAHRARQVGIERFIAQTLAHNHRMRRVFARSGYPLVTRAGGGVVGVELDLRARPVTTP